MSEHELFESVELARNRLTALRARLEQAGTAPVSQEMVHALRDLQELWDKLQARYGLLREILDRTNDVVFAKDRDGRYAMINPRGADMFGLTMAEVLGADDRALFDQAEAERIMATDREVMSTGVPKTCEETFDFRGVPTTLLTITTARYDADRNIRGVIGIAQDVTDRRRDEREVATHHDRMRSMAAEIVFGEERLRRSLAAELHNGLGQDIALAKLKLSVLRNSASVELHDPLRGIEKLVEQADHSLRSIVFQISPPSLHDLGLVAALQWLGEDIGKKYGIAVRIEDHHSPTVADERIRVILFRAVRELLINIATHTSAREAHVNLDSDDNLLRITVEDAGAGFDAAGVDLQGYGLFGIREQLRHVGGSMHIDSTPGRGTTVALTTPLATAGMAMT